ncbi:hypothetical protein D3C84_535010 [compost metagenome]
MVSRNRLKIVAPALGPGGGDRQCVPRQARRRAKQPGRNVRRSILAIAPDAQQKITRSRSNRAAVSQMPPPEYPTQHAQLLVFELRRAVGFGGVFVAVVAVQAQGAVGALAEAVNAQAAIVQQGVELAFDDVFQATVDGQGAAAWQ